MSSTAPIRGVVFDLDGTLIDSYAAIAASLNDARAAFDLPPLAEDLVRKRVGHGLEALIEEFVGAARVEEGVRLFRERYTALYAAHTRALPGAEFTLRELAGRGLALAVASNKPARFSVPILEQLGLARFFRCIAGPDVVGTTKPDPQMIAFCLRRLALACDEALYVGDMALDVESAERAGVRVLLVASGSSDAAELRRTGRCVLGSIAELPRHLQLAG